MAKAGFNHVVNLTEDTSSYDPNPLRLLCSLSLEDLAHGGGPEDPEREEALIRKATESVVRTLSAGESVVIHCAGGRGRTGTVIACVLKVFGHDPNEIVDALNSLHISRGKAGWPESPWQSELVRGWPTPDSGLAMPDWRRNESR